MGVRFLALFLPPSGSRGRPRVAGVERNTTPGAREEGKGGGLSERGVTEWKKKKSEPEKRGGQTEKKKKNYYSSPQLRRRMTMTDRGGARTRDSAAATVGVKF